MSAEGGVGFECELKFGSIVIGHAQDVDGPNGKADAVDVSKRAGQGWKEFKQGLKEWGITLEHLFVGDNAGLQALRTAWLTGAEVHIDAKDHAGNGWSGNCLVLEVGFKQPLSGAVAFPVTLQGTGVLSVVGSGS